MLIGLAIIAAFFAGFALGVAPWRRRRATPRGVPTAADVKRAAQRAHREHEQHSETHAPWPAHLRERALHQRAKEALVEDGFTHLPHDLDHHIRAAKKKGR